MKTNFLKTKVGKGLCGAFLAIEAALLGYMAYSTGHADGFHECHEFYDHELKEMMDSLKKNSVKED